ncbi:MAG: CRISPR-associated endonuclease Cas1 [Kofleriaceae bacterium]
MVAPLPQPELVPARMLNEHAYCPRLAHLEWVQGDFTDNADTVDGRFQHRNVDKERGALPTPAAAPAAEASEPAGAPPTEDDVSARAAKRAPPAPEALPATPEDVPASPAPEPLPATTEDNVSARAAKRAGPGARTKRGVAPAPEAAPEILHSRSVMLSAPGHGLIARMDLLEAEGLAVTPVDYKRGRAPEIPEGAWEPERVQLCAQALILEENGYHVTHGVLYFVASKQRVEIAIDDALRARTLELLVDLRASAARAEPPPPLRDSPKCPRCSLVSICLPDETNLLRDHATVITDDDGAQIIPLQRVRRLAPARDDALPLYVHTAGTRVGRTGAELVVEPREGPKQTVRLSHTSHVAVFGAVQLSTQALHALCERGINIAYLSTGGWLQAITRGMDHKHVELRRRQFAAAADPRRCLALAKRLVTSKIRNCRTLIRRNADDPPTRTLDRLRDQLHAAARADRLESLLGIEGTAARSYFQAYARLLNPPQLENEPPTTAFDFTGRNRRPPKDPVNALLSLGYSLLTKDLVIAAMAVGFDPYLGFYHQPRYGRPALALDVMEEFRPLIVDSMVLSVINTGALRASDFLHRAGAYALTPAGRTKFLRAYERRIDEEITHPVFGYRISYRRTLEVQLRLLSRYLQDEIPEYPAFTTR